MYDAFCFFTVFRPQAGASARQCVLALKHSLAVVQLHRSISLLFHTRQYEGFQSQSEMDRLAGLLEDKLCPPPVKGCDAIFKKNTVFHSQ